MSQSVPSDFTIADVLAWARTKPADEAYSYTDTHNCALCQFLRESGRATDPRVNPSNWRTHNSSGERFPLPARIDDAVCGDTSADETFGALVTRLEKLCPDAPVPPSEWTRFDAYMSDIARFVTA